MSDDRYIARLGRHGAVVYDALHSREIELDEVVSMLNAYNRVNQLAPLKFRENR